MIYYDKKNSLQVFSPEIFHTHDLFIYFLLYFYITFLNKDKQ